MNTPAYHPQSNGQVEREVQNVKNLLKRTYQENPNQSLQHIIHEIQYAFRFALTPLLKSKS